MSKDKAGTEHPYHLKAEGGSRTRAGVLDQTGSPRGPLHRFLCVMNRVKDVIRRERGDSEGRGPRTITGGPLGRRSVCSDSRCGAALFRIARTPRTVTATSVTAETAPVAITARRIVVSSSSLASCSWSFASSFSSRRTLGVCGVKSSCLTSPYATRTVSSPTLTPITDHEDGAAPGTTSRVAGVFLTGGHTVQQDHVPRLERTYRQACMALQKGCDPGLDGRAIRRVQPHHQILCSSMPTAPGASIRRWRVLATATSSFGSRPSEWARSHAFSAAS